MLMNETLNAPNALTLGRILLVPLMLFALLDGDGEMWPAAVVFAVAATSDWLDGYLARSRDSITTFGKVMDPIADKLLVITALVGLVALDRLAAWVAVVVVARELAVSGLRVAAGRRGIVIAASDLGRAKTMSQVAAVLALILASDPAAPWVMALVLLAVAITILSGIDYFLAYRRGEAGKHVHRVDADAPSLPTQQSQGTAAASPLRRPAGSPRPTREPMAPAGDGRASGVPRQPRPR